jgi:hypothetical protein
MIVSASRRTDIPGLYFAWFLNRLRARFVLVRNPFAPSRVSRVVLGENVECVVFWTKNAAPALHRMNEFHAFGIPCYFLYTVTSYGNDLERSVPPEQERIDAFRRLSDMIGPERVVWRYDPIIFSEPPFSRPWMSAGNSSGSGTGMDLEYHIRHFADLAKKLEGATGRCVISFLDMYKKCRARLEPLHIVEPTEETMVYTAMHLRGIADSCGISVQSCAEEVDLSVAGVERGGCIDGLLISRITGRSVRLPKDRSQRKACRCGLSVDIGAYDSCTNSCLYCYATASPEAALKNHARHDPESPLLIGRTRSTDRIVERSIAPS